MMNRFSIVLLSILVLAVSTCTPATGPDDVIAMGNGLVIHRGRLSDAALASLPHPAVPKTSSSRPPITNYWWTLSAYFLDNANITGLASDANNCTTSTTPCKTWLELVARFNESPGPWRIGQATTITIMSADSEQMILDNFETTGSGSVLFQGSLTSGAGQQLCSGTLGATANSASVATVRSSNTLPVAGGLPAGCSAVGAQTLIIDSTKGTHMWCDAGVSGTTCQVTQPFTALAPPFSTTSQSWTEVQATSAGVWATGDTVAMYTPVGVNIVSAQPTTSGSTNAAIYLDKLQLTGTSSMIWGNSVIGSDLSSVSTETIRFTTTPTSFDFGCTNCFFVGPTVGGPSGGGAFLRLIGGSLFGNANLTGNATLLDGDIELENATTLWAGVSMGLVNTFQDTLSIRSGMSYLNTVASGYATSFLWGAGTLSVLGNARFGYLTTNSAATTLFVTLKLNNHTTATSYATGTWTSSVSLTPTQLDTAVGLGGFGGVAYGAQGALIASTTN